MRIGIDISTVLNHGKDVGAGRYITNLVKSLFELDFDDEFILTGRYITDEYLWLAEELRQHYIRVNKDIGEKSLKTAFPYSNPVNERAPKTAFGESDPSADNNNEEKSSIGTGGYKGNTGLTGNTTETGGTGRYATDMEGRRSASWAGDNKSDKLSFRLIKTTQKKLDLSNRAGFPPLEFYGFKTDIFHCPDFLIAPTLNKRIVLTIHDLAFIRFPQFNFEWFVKKYTKLVRRNAYAAAGIIADSQSTKNDIVEFFGIKEDKVTVVHLAGDEVFKKLNANEIDYGVATKYKVTKKFILSVGTIEPRKNYVTLIRAFNRLKSENQAKIGGSGGLSGTVGTGNSGNSGEFGSKGGFGNYGSSGSPDNPVNYSNPYKNIVSSNPNQHNSPCNLQLVIVGRTGWMSEAIIAEYNSSPFKKDIILAGRLSDNELLQMYNMAELFVYPSIFEGFGLPVVEAMQCGLPVVASNCSSIPEIVDDKRLLFNPTDESDILNKINMVLSSDTLKAKLSEEALKNAAKFSWKNTAQKTLEVYREMYIH